MRSIAQTILCHLFNSQSTFDSLKEITSILIGKGTIEIEDNGLMKILKVNGCHIALTPSENPLIMINIGEDGSMAGWMDSRIKYGCDKPYRETVEKVKSFFVELESQTK